MSVSAHRRFPAQVTWGSTAVTIDREISWRDAAREFRRLEPRFSVVLVQRLHGTRDADAEINTRRSLDRRDDELA